MKPVVVLLGLVLLLDTTIAAEVSRGDVFDVPQKEGTSPSPSPKPYTTTFMPTSDTAAPTMPSSFPSNVTQGSTTPVDRDAAPCSGQAFDAFLQLKNGSIYAFRGKYFFEMDDKSILPGYPKLIEDVWGISGPISAAFTRINCQGKTYIFKGNQYWRFEGNVLDEDYPRLISQGFDGIPDEIDAAFALPAPSHRGKEKAYFFKGDKYYQYGFKHQPSHEECFQMSRSSPSVLFTQYTDLFCDNTWEDLFAELFGGSSVSSLQTGPHFTSRDWRGIRPPVDAAIVGRVYISPKPTSAPTAKKWKSWRKRPSKRRGQKRRQSGHLDDFWFYDLFDLSDYSESSEEHNVQEYQSTPVQNVYFFQRDKYYRVALQTKRVDAGYPRSIGKYWLGCEREDVPDTSRAEKR
ncbi:vitronectin b isoform X3 [Archocentrus centrarchus]|uniref:vitronectin b isoform X3 n=1 Tax=Archocentrus centrarchus TaxID=63155 RepID=UPI0011E9F633|nr:vitronectin-like isoform X3 [Archocentrus centrarchus]